MKKYLFIMLLFLLFFTTKAFCGSNNPQNEVVVGTSTVFSLVDQSFSYGTIHSTYNATALELSDTVYTAMNVNISTATFLNTEVNLASGTIKILVEGLYICNFNMSASGINNNDIHGGFSINGSDPLGRHEINFTVTGTTNFQAVSKTSLIRLEVNDTVSTKWENTSASNDITPEFYCLNIYKLSN